MSHVADMDCEIKDLASFALACDELGLEFVKDQKTYKWFGRHVGDYPIPTGFTKEDMGKCEHAVRVKGNPEAYEIGLVKRRDGRPGYTMLFDFFAGGYGMEKIAGKDTDKLLQEYATQVNIKQAKRKGFTVTRKMVEGNVILNARRLARR